jgi:hypothetical protein
MAKPVDLKKLEWAMKRERDPNVRRKLQMEFKKALKEEELRRKKEEAAQARKASSSKAPATSPATPGKDAAAIRTAEREMKKRWSDFQKETKSRKPDVKNLQLMVKKETDQAQQKKMKVLLKKIEKDMAKRAKEEKGKATKSKPRR